MYATGVYKSEVCFLTFSLSFFSMYFHHELFLIYTKFSSLISSPAVYHTTFDFPSNPDVERRLVEPPEGCSEESMVERLVVYHRHTLGLRSCYDKISKDVNADQPTADVLSQGE